MPGCTSPLTCGDRASGRQLVGDFDVDFLFGHSAEEVVGEHVSSVLVTCGGSRHGRSFLSDLLVYRPRRRFRFRSPQVSGKVCPGAHSRARSA
ncbi:hypothetical protein RHA1_ro01711 [Rhodococcus jostii RHA1]|uniref:Uncharacterized protein n=1 Tax=Rhodococcus jostii (strain RHA1) TaxID=101510 RepID=Q0SG12_RHOJR|nr:hypothetical protein RHA1_ro01711 [Rhodococcus jostii RHA1]